MILLNEVLCMCCQGQGMIEVMNLVCCGYISDHGECCSRPVQDYDVDYCNNCNGLGLLEG